MAVLPSPWRWVAGVAPGPSAVCLMISPRMYDSVKRLEPTCSVGPAIATAPVAIARAPDKKPIDMLARMNVPRRRRFHFIRTESRMIPCGRMLSLRPGRCCLGRGPQESTKLAGYLFHALVSAPLRTVGPRLYDTCQPRSHGLDAHRVGGGSGRVQQTRGVLCGAGQGR